MSLIDAEEHVLVPSVCFYLALAHVTIVCLLQVWPFFGVLTRGERNSEQFLVAKELEASVFGRFDGRQTTDVQNRHRPMDKGR